MIRARPLEEGSTVAVIAPSGPASAIYGERLAAGIRGLEQLGVKVGVSPTAHRQSGWTAGTPEERADDLHAAFARPEIAGAFCTIGGHLGSQVLEHIDFDLIADNPTILCGFSDITVFHHAIHERTGLVTFYGPMVMTDWAESPEPFEYTVASARRALFDPEPPRALPRSDVMTDLRVSWDQPAPRALRPAPPRSVLAAGTAEGPLLPGCLPSMIRLLGTPWQPDYRGRILAIETPADYSPEDGAADLSQLRNAGLLESCAGIAVGRPYGWDEGEREHFYAALLASTADLEVPIVTELEFGHTSPIATLPVGVRTRIEGAELVLLEAGVSAG